MIVEQAPAKLNLFLEVLGRRKDGYHELVTVMQEIALADTLEAEPADAFSLETQGLAIPPGGENLVLKASRLLASRTGSRSGAAFRLTKRIPAGAGLGGGSSDAAAALRVCARLWDLRIPEPDLAAVAAEVGSDVPFFLRGGTALCTGRGEHVEPLPCPPPLPVLLLWPGVPLSTGAVYGSHAGEPSDPRSPEPLLKALGQGDPRAVGARLFNRLEPAALRVLPSLREVRDRLRPERFWGVCMSGSGSAFFGVSKQGAEADDDAISLPWLRVRTSFLLGDKTNA